MKKLTLSILTVFAVTTFCFAQKHEKSDSITVPAAVEAAFNQKFNSVKPVWEKEDSTYEAEFTYEGKETEALFTATGEWLETETEIQLSDLPAPAANYIQKKYKKTAIKEVAKIYHADGKITYEVEIKSKDVVFDEAGNLISQAK